MKHYVDLLQWPPATHRASRLLLDLLKGNLAIRLVNVGAITLLGMELLQLRRYWSLLVNTADFLLARKKITFLFIKACVINPARTSVFNSLAESLSQKLYFLVCFPKWKQMHSKHPKCHDRFGHCSLLFFYLTQSSAAWLGPRWWHG